MKHATTDMFRLPRNATFIRPIFLAVVALTIARLVYANFR